MHLSFLKSKLHRATVTGSDVDYEGSLAISRDLCDMVGLAEYEKLLVGNLSNGNRFETYAIYAPAGEGIFLLNGAAAYLGNVGDKLTIMNFAWLTEEEAAVHTPKIIVLGENNRVVSERGIHTVV